MKLAVDVSQRKAKMRAHTATHLLHAILSYILWETSQAWSYVDDDILRFDFTTKKPLTTQQIQTINTLVNLWIRQWAHVNIAEMSMDEASKTWAKAFFEDKYGDMVRVVNIEKLISETWSISSVELCGGTHVSDTWHIWAFIISEQSAVASWVRRITAYTWTRVSQIATERQDRLNKLSTRLDCQPWQLEDKLEKILKDYTHIKQDHESLQTSIIQNHLQEAQKSADSREWVDFCIYIWDESQLAHHDYKTIINQAKQLRSNQDWLMYNDTWAYALYTWASNTAKSLAKSRGIRWWWSDQFVQGKDESVIK